MKAKLFAALLFLCAAACGDDSSSPSEGAAGNGGTNGSGGTGGSGGGASAVACGSVSDDGEGNLITRAAADNNYSFSSSFTIDVTPVKPSSELSFDWSGVTEDFLGHAVDPTTDIDMVTLLMWRLSQAELESKLNDDALRQSDLVALAMIYTEDSKTSGGLFEFTSFGLPIEPDMLLTYLDPEVYDPETHSYTVMAVTGTTAGEGTRMMKSFRLDPASENTEVVIDSDSTSLEYSVDLTSLTATQIPPNEAEIAVDWADMTVNAMGHEFTPTSIDEVLVARYSLTPEEMEAEFLSLDRIADEIWRGSVPSGTSTVLSSLKNDAGEPFSGIDDTGTWIVALVCGGCANPAPWYLSILKPCTSSSAP